MTGPAILHHAQAHIASILITGVLTVLIPAYGAAGDSPFGVSPEKADTLRPVRVVSPPVIDGELNEEFWRHAQSITGFTTFAPDFGIVPKEQTEVSLAYDAGNIYFGFRCYDNPADIKASLSPRDRMLQDDFVCINLDAFNDQQGLNAFYVNPLGIQGDSKFAANSEDFSPDYVWYSAGKLDSMGYSVEICIPFKSLRYRNDDPTIMGVILERYIRRRDEHSSFPRLDPAKGFALLTQMFPLRLSDIEHYTLWELLPALTATRQDVRRGTALERDRQDADLSLTAKYGITSDLILDGTLNPDFSQVESDAGQVDVNLRYSLFYSEKRPFFLEGQDNFNLGATSNDYDPMIFYSRTIADPLLGAKLSGKVGSSNTIAALYAMDRVLEADREALGEYVHTPVIRYKRAFSDDSYIGMLYAGRELKQSNNHVIGFDEIIRISESATISGNGFLSTAKDAPAGEVMKGHTLGVQFNSSDRDVTYLVSARTISEHFRADMGYLTRTGFWNFIGYFNPRIYPKSELIQRIGFELTTSHTNDLPGGLWETANDLAVNLFFGGSWLFRNRFNYSTEIFAGERFQTSGYHTQIQGQIVKDAFINLVYRRTRAIYYMIPEQGKSNFLGGTLTVDPTDNLRLDGSLTYSDLTTDASGEKVYDYLLTRVKMTYQVNEKLFFRGIGEYNDYRKELRTELLASFTYIPGTVIYLGYGSIFDKVRWDGSEYVESDGFLEMRRGIFLKMSYLWRS